MANYYSRQFNRLHVKDLQYAPLLKITNSEKDESTNFISLNDESATALVLWLKENYKVVDSEKKLTIDEVESHLTKWFGENWDNQKGSQVYAMVIDLLQLTNKI